MSDVNENALAERDAEIERLQRELAQRDAVIEGLRAEIAELRRLLEESRRSGRRQAAPFSKGAPKPDAKRSGRKGGGRDGRHSFRSVPDRDPDRVIEVALPDTCSCCGSPDVEMDRVVEQWTEDIPTLATFQGYSGDATKSLIGTRPVTPAGYFPLSRSFGESGTHACFPGGMVIDADTEINVLQPTNVREGTELMPVSASQLMAQEVVMSEHVSLLKNSGIQTTMLNTLTGPSVRAVSGLNDLFQSVALEAGRAVSRLVEPSALESVRHVHEILGSARFVEQFSAFNSAKILAEDFARLTDISRLISSQFSVFDGAIPSAALRRATLFGVRGWESAGTAFVKQPDAKRLLPLEAFGRGTLGVTSAATALLPERDDIAAGVDDDRARLLGPASFAEGLRESLGSLDRRLPRRLDGAWERVSRRGPDAASQAAHSLMETIDWALRLAAPESEVLAWHAAEGRSDKELYNGGPTRALRVEWLLRGRPGEADAARLHLRALSGLVSVIQSYKHAEDEADIEAVARLIPTVEGLLIFVLGVSPAGD